MKLTDPTTPPARTVRRLTRERLRSLVRELVLDGDAVPAWHDHAACAGMGEDLFFPLTEAGSAGAAQVEQAKAVCAGCPVRVTCLADAMSREAPTARYGVFGGLSARDRDRLYVRLRDHALGADALSESHTTGAVA